MRFEIKRHFTTRSERVKSVDIHETEPWFLASLYNGHVIVYNYETNTVLKTIEAVENIPVRAAKFICRKQWIVTGSDDYQIRVFSYDTTERIKAIEAHSDYIRSIAVHPTQPFVLSSSDDMMIKLWDWEKGWQNTMVFEGHSHYVMQVVFNPKDPNTFCSGSLDRSVKIWSLSSTTANFTLEGHEKGVNCVDYFKGGDKPYLISGADDNTARVWDYTSKRCVQVLEGHAHNVSAVLFHPDLPVIITASEDHSVKVWHSTTYQLETTLSYGMERCWALCAHRGTNRIMLGYDEGSVVVKIGREEPPVSMDSNGKVIWAKQSDIQTANIKAATDVQDGEIIVMKQRNLESCQIYPQKISHSPNGRFVSVCGDGEFIIYTAMGWRNTTFGSALEFVWSADSKEYAVRDAYSRVVIYEMKEKTRKEKTAYRASFAVEGLFGGQLLSIKSPDFVEFREWNEMKLIRVIEMSPTLVLWSEAGDMVALCSESMFFILRYNAAEVDAVLASGVELPADGIPSAFEVVCEVADCVKTGCWVGQCFIFTTASSRLHYCVGGEVIVLHHLDTTMYMLGYLPKEDRIYLMDKDYNIYSYQLLLAVLEFQSLVARGDVQSALGILSAIPEDHHNKCARFLETKGLKEIALQVTRDPDHRFELAVQLRKLDVAFEIASTSQSALQWKQLADLSLSMSRLDLTLECMVRADDLGGLLLLLTSTADRDGLDKLASRAFAAGKANIAFVCFLLLGRLSDCVDLLIASKRFPEAAFFCSTYMPSRVDEVTRVWKSELGQTNVKAASALAIPSEYPNLFPNFLESLEREEVLRGFATRLLPAELYPDTVKHGLLSVLASYQPEPVPAPASAPAPAPAPSPAQPKVEAVVAHVTTPAPVAVPVEPVASVPEPSVVSERSRVVPDQSQNIDQLVEEESEGIIVAEDVDVDEVLNELDSDTIA